MAVLLISILREPESRNIRSVKYEYYLHIDSKSTLFRVRRENFKTKKEVNAQPRGTSVLQTDLRRNPIFL